MITHRFETGVALVATTKWPSIADSYVHSCVIQQRRKRATKVMLEKRGWAVVVVGQVSRCSTVEQLCCTQSKVTPLPRYSLFLSLSLSVKTRLPHWGLPLSLAPSPQLPLTTSSSSIIKRQEKAVCVCVRECSQQVRGQAVMAAAEVRVRKRMQVNTVKLGVCSDL